MVSFTRRTVLGSLAASAIAPADAAPAILTRPIPSSGEAIPLVGLGSWITFNVGNDPVARASCADVMRAFFAAGGRMIDSSPMYGSSQPVIGEGLKKIGAANVFSADKVWISSRRARAGADRSLARLLGRAEIRSAAGAQPARLGRASAARCSP